MDINGKEIYLLIASPYFSFFMHFTDYVNYSGLKPEAYHGGVVKSMSVV